MAPRTRNNTPETDHASLLVQDAEDTFDIPAELRESQPFISFIQGVLHRVSPSSPNERMNLTTTVENSSRFLKRLSSKVESMDLRLESVEGKLVSMDAKIGSLDAKVGSLDSRLGSLESKLEDAIEKLSNRLDQALRYGQENVDPQFSGNIAAPAYPYLQRQVVPANQPYSHSGNQYMMYPPQEPSTNHSNRQNATPYATIAPRRF